MEDRLLNEIYELLGNSAAPTLRSLVEQKKTELGITSDLQLSKVVGIDKSTLERILNGDNKKVDLFSMVKLDEFFGIGIAKLVQIYVSSLKPEFVGELERARNASYIIRRFDLPGLKRAQIIPNTTDFVAIENRLTSFFGLESILDYDREVGAVLFSRTNAKSDDKMREFWVRSAHLQFERIDNPNPYDEAALKSLIPKIRPFTREEDTGLLKVIRALYRVGVTVIVQSYLSKTQVRGGTFAVKNKPCIVLTDYNKTYPTLWFALMHELYHVLYDLEAIRQWKYHLTGDTEPNFLLFNEDDADYFGRELLFPKKNLDFIKPLINSPASVATYAQTNRVHPGIIYAFYCYEENRLAKKNLYGVFQHLFGNSDRALAAIRTNPWDKASIFQEVEIIRRKFEVTPN